jgi:chromosome segregation protein
VNRAQPPQAFGATGFFTCMIKALFPDRTPDPPAEPVEAAPEPPAGPDPFAELQVVLENERAVRERVLSAARTQHFERQAQLDAWAAELAERERLIGEAHDELEHHRQELVEQRTEIVAEYSRVQELSVDAGTRVAELETAARDRSEAELRVATQSAAIGERERALDRDRTAFEAVRQQAEARLAARELATSERDAAVAGRERIVRDREADFVTEARRLDQRQSALRAAEARLRDAQIELERRQAALEETFEQREALLAEREADLSTRPDRRPVPDVAPIESDITVPFTAA